MDLAVDIGNTTVGLAGVSGRRVFWSESFMTGLSREERLRSLERIHRRRFGATAPRSIIICSVVPLMTVRMEKELRKIFHAAPLVVGRDLRVPMVNRYAKPRQVGQDRLVVAHAAKVIYGAPVIVIDLGTAITFDVVSRAGHYEGGMIIPGITMSTESLFARTALLPSVKKIHFPGGLIGKTTEESILSGIFYGYGALCSGLIDQTSKYLKGRPKVVVTGGHAALMRRFISRQVTKIDLDLVFRGLSLLLQGVSK
jgi:type III pantothenate kinase